MASVYNSAGKTSSLSADLDASPSPGDDVFVEDGGHDYTASETALVGVALASFTVLPGFEGEQFYYDAPFQLDTDALDHYGACTYAGFSIKTGTTTASAVIRPNNAAARTKLAGTGSGAVITNLAAESGTTTVQASLQVTNPHAKGRSAELLLTKGGGAFTTARASDGARLTVSRDGALIVASGAGTRVVVDDTDVTPTDVELYDGATLEYAGGDITDSSAARVTTRGRCTLDLRKLTRSITVDGWDIDGALTILEPPPGVTYDGPASTEWKGVAPTLVPFGSVA